MARARHPSTVAPEVALVGSTPVARSFFAGRYAEIVARTFDAPGSVVDDADIAFTVGALTFLGRVEEAASCFDGWRTRCHESARTQAASHFFLGVAYARAGDFARSHELLVAGARARMRLADPWAAAFVFQGLACHRYFTGRYRAAARHALRALRAAHSASFPYAQMLSTDLRGHAMTQLGQFHAGTALLEQAKSYAERVGFEMNANAIECSIAIYRAKFKLGPDALDGLEGLLKRRSHDSYSTRMVATQAAIQYALRGRAADAERVLADADRDAMKQDVRRAKVGSLLARLYFARFSGGARACAELLDATAALTEKEDVAFRAELLSFELYVGRALGDNVRTSRALAELCALRGRAEHYLATAALELHAPDRSPVFAEDEITPLLRATADRDLRVLSRLLALGVVGPIAEVLGLEPGRRVILITLENTVVIEDHGNVWSRSSPPRWLAPLLRVLARGGASKETIVAEIWGLKRYHPERHDSLVRTTIHRLRAFLEPRGEWIVVTPTGYALDSALHVIGTHAPAMLEPTLVDHDPLDVALPPSAPRGASRNLDALLLERIASAPLSSPEIARHLGVSESTVLRALRRLVRLKKVVRRGAARATTYRLR